MSSVKLFSGTNSRALAEKIADAFGTELGALEVEQFKDGEMCATFTRSVRGDSVFLVQSTVSPSDNLMELLLMIDAAKRASAAYVTAVLPYFGYARQDRKSKPRMSIGAKLVANLLTSAGANRVMTCDLHAGQIQGFFDIPVDHLDSSAIFVPYLETLHLENLVFASPDVGGVVRTKKYAKYFGAGMVVCHKQRKKANVIESMQILGDVTDANVVIIDDLLDTGGTMVRAAGLLMEKGARSVRAVCAHGLFSGDAYQILADAPIEELLVTDSVPLKPNPPKNLKVLSMADLFADAIQRVLNHESISTLFIH